MVHQKTGARNHIQPDLRGRGATLAISVLPDAGIARANVRGFREAMMKTPLCMIAALAMTLIGPSAQAKVSKLEITSKQAYGLFQAGDYVRWDGRIVGELAPTAETIPDLEKATRDANGKVQYVARVSLFSLSSRPPATAPCWLMYQTAGNPWQM